MRRRQGGTFGLVLVLAAAGLAACSGRDSPHVASLGTRSAQRDATSTTLSAAGDPTRLLDEWTDCMRRHGDPDQADPTIDSDRDIDVNWDPDIPGGVFGTNKGGEGNDGPGQYCRAYLSAAQSALGGDQTHSSDQATLEKFSECMRANGIADFPDAINGTLSFNVGAGGDLNPNNPAFQNAAKLCERTTGARVPFAGGSPPPGIVKLDGAGPLSGAGTSSNG